MNMPNRYEIRCPNCGSALVVPADTDKECAQILTHFHKVGEFHCPACRHNFQGLGNVPNPVAPWRPLVDKNGASFNFAKELLDAHFERATQHQYLPTPGDGEGE